MESKDKTPKKGEDEKKPSKQTPGSNSSGGGTSSFVYSTPASSKHTSSPHTPLSPPENGDSPYSETRKDIIRADSPNCTAGETTTSEFSAFSALEGRYTSFTQIHGNGNLFLLRELGLRLLYNSDRNDY